MAIPPAKKLTIDEKVSELVKGVTKFSYTVPGEVRTQLTKIIDTAIKAGEPIDYNELEMIFITQLRAASKQRVMPRNRRNLRRILIPALIGREWLDLAA